MKTYTIPKTDLTASRLAYGCATLGWHKLERFARITDLAAAEGFTFPNFADSLRIINTAYDNGITFFDLADVYGFGNAEAAFGEVLRQSPGLRDKIVIQSKCGQRFPDDPEPGLPARVDLSRRHIVSSVERSLRDLGTDRVDILLLHHPDPLVQPEEVAEALDALHSAGKVRYFGVSNHSATQLALLQKCVRQPLIANQIKLSLLHSHFITDGYEAVIEMQEHVRQFKEFATRGMEIELDPDHTYTALTHTGTLDYCRLHDIQVQAYSPLRGDLLRPPTNASPQVKQAAQLVADLAQAKNVTSSAIALAWLLRHPAGIMPIIGATNPKHLADNCAADRISLTREEWYTLFVYASGIQAGIPSRKFYTTATEDAH